MKAELVKDLRGRIQRNLQIIKLDNLGHTILSYKSDLPVAYISVTFGIGASLEDRQHAGLSHFIEHLVFKGSSRFGVGEVAELVNSLAGYLNAYTAYDHTSFYSIGPAESLGQILRALYDMTMRATFPEDELEKEREVVLEEIRQSEDEPLSKAFKRAMELLFPDHPFGKPILGYFRTISKISREEIISFWRTYYHPANSLSLIVSPLDPEEIRDVVREELSPVPSSDVSFRDYFKRMRELITILPQPREGKHIIELGLNKAYVVGMGRGYRLTSPKYPQQDLALMIMSWGRSSPLKLRLKEELKLADHVSLEDFSIGELSLTLLSAITDEEKVDSFIEELTNLINSYAIKKEDLQRAKALLVYSEISSLESVENIASKLLDGFLLGDPLWFLKEMEAVMNLEESDVSLRDLELPLWVISK